MDSLQNSLQKNAEDYLNSLLCSTYRKVKTEEWGFRQAVTGYGQMLYGAFSTLLSNPVGIRDGGRARIYKYCCIFYFAGKSGTLLHCERRKQRSFKYSKTSS